MGADIHLYVERRTPTGWERVRPEAWTCPWCDGKGTRHKGAPCYWCKGEGKTTKEYHERRYDLFAMLESYRSELTIATRKVVQQESLESGDIELF